MKDYKRIVCCLETWIKEIQEPNTGSNLKCIAWIVDTYLNEIRNGDYVDDVEYSEWVFQETIENHGKPFDVDNYNKTLTKLGLTK